MPLTKAGAKGEWNKSLRGLLEGCGPRVIFHCPIRKRGSGKGIMSNTKWKDNYYFVVAEQCAIYFSKADKVSDSNKPSEDAVIQLAGASLQEQPAQGKYVFELVAEKRKYTFACSEEYYSQCLSHLRAQMAPASITR